jgi:hypothetical protein
MKRRRFLSLIGATAVVPALPMGGLASVPRVTKNYAGYQKLVRGVAAYAAETNQAMRASAIAAARTKINPALRSHLLRERATDTRPDDIPDTETHNG